VEQRLKKLIATFLISALTLSTTSALAATSTPTPKPTAKTSAKPTAESSTKETKKPAASRLQALRKMVKFLQRFQQPHNCNVNRQIITPLLR